MNKILFLNLMFLNTVTYSVSPFLNVNTFLPTSSVIQEIYGQAWPSVYLSVDHIQPFSEIKQLDIFGQIGWIGKNGYSLNFNESTNIRLLPLAFGLKWLERVSDYAEIYIGLAPQYWWLKIKNDSNFVPQLYSTGGWGGEFVLGSFIELVYDLNLHLFANYSHKKFSAPPSTNTYIGFDINISGFWLGGGFGWKF